MERRVRLVVGLLLVGALLALSVPLALALGDRRTAALAVERDRQLSVLAELAAREGDVAAAVARYHEVYDEDVLVTDATGRVLAGAGALDTGEAEVAEAVRVGLVGQPTPALERVLPWTRDQPLRSAVAFEDGDVAALALLRVDTRAAAGDVARGWGWVLLVGVALLLAALALARWLSRWAVRPVHSLESAAHDLAQGGRGGGAVLASGPPELRGLVDEFNRMVEVVQRSLDDQRRLVADASHQLRNPLAAVRLRADSLGAHLHDSGARTHAGLTSELERLERLLDQLLRLARAQESGTSGVAGARAPQTLAPLAQVLAERVEAWAPAAAAAEQSVVVVEPVPDLEVARDDLEQVLDVVLDNAVRHAGAGAGVCLRADAPAAVAGGAAGGVAGRQVVVEVDDDGPGLGEGEWSRAAERFWRGSDDPHGSGLGLSIARELLRGAGGDLSVGPGPRGGVLVRVSLPVAGDGP
ncbi:signal transduction histidine kinase [Nocardioides salarius]|uniref:histidine kinase n=1 Tax=Nocardioides salarius TaxID=374513 RepID=A0ABS2M8V7_9ACTN|nr:HAMP domain-containing sensor histidine kinase [Nocardioides salarius]MBM7507619.1 signal transduction histidine kinase [Nocardioides salarius]